MVGYIQLFSIDSKLNVSYLTPQRVNNYNLFNGRSHDEKERSEVGEELATKNLRGKSKQLKLGETCRHPNAKVVEADVGNSQPEVDEELATQTKPASRSCQSGEKLADTRKSK